ncbi:hypothetical protein AVEN_156848-1 [Araneus ventricosus]|uniref:Secreted protein n=1 Tax=Araneus ventricosus TaxID=182803 RepID=A0A4Y2GRI2_ARAVE|nr:hypothetical protein AVEN_196956-1 [Araneus ventricosus]GBM55558.1 hypothetical protein AVEN_156848-1 [Araneus ventricosus]
MVLASRALIFLVDVSAEIILHNTFELQRRAPVSRMACHLVKVPPIDLSLRNIGRTSVFLSVPGHEMDLFLILSPLSCETFAIVP